MNRLAGNLGNRMATKPIISDRKATDDDAILKPAQIRIRVIGRDATTLDKLCNNVLNRNEVASALLHAALQAVRENQDKIQLPPKFKVIE